MSVVDVVVWIRYTTLKKQSNRIGPLTIVTVIISSNVHLKVTITFQATDSKLCKPKDKKKGGGSLHKKKIRI